MLQRLVFVLMVAGIPTSAFAFNNAACEPDTNRFCLGIITQAGAPALLKCLREHEKELSTRCRKAIENDPQAAPAQSRAAR